MCAHANYRYSERLQRDDLRKLIENCNEFVNIPTSRILHDPTQTPVSPRATNWPRARAMCLVSRRVRAHQRPIRHPTRCAPPIYVASSLERPISPSCSTPAAPPPPPDRRRTLEPLTRARVHDDARVQRWRNPVRYGGGGGGGGGEPEAARRGTAPAWRRRCCPALPHLRLRTTCAPAAPALLGPPPQMAGLRCR